jgi:putative hydrolase of the HAD superfamily
VPVRAVIFDLGHTVWDFAPSIHGRRLAVLRLYETLASHGYDDITPAALDDALNAAAQRWFEEWYSNPELLEQPPSETLISDGLARLDVVVPEELQHDLAATLFAAELDIPVVEPDTLAALATLDARGMVMGCVTNTITLHEGIEDALRRLGLHRYFRVAVSSSGAGYRKPHESLFRCALDALGVRASDAVFVGDRLFDDISGAHAAGMRTVLTRQYRQEPLDVAAVRPDAVISRLAELPAVIERLEQSERPNATMGSNQ